MGKRKSIKWSDVDTNKGKPNPKVICKYCSATWVSSSVERIDDHMARCTSLPEEFYPRYGREAVEGPRPKKQARLSSEQFSITQEDQTECDTLLAEAIYSSGVPFNFVRRIILVLSFANK